tara:strand:+ start:74 stop:268 length:195 start_codon:yes stop_codon:yes gene_type:complete
MENQQNKKEIEEQWIPHSDIVEKLLKENPDAMGMDATDKAKFLVEATNLFHAKYTELNRAKDRK